MKTRLTLIAMGVVAALFALAACSGDSGTLRADLDQAQDDLAAANADLATARMERDDAMSRLDAMGGGSDSMQAELDQARDDLAAAMAQLSASTGNRLATVKQRGRLVCASNNSLAGFGRLDADGETRGFDIDLCRAVAAAVLGDADAVDYIPTVASERGPRMQSGEADMMSRNTTWTTSRNAQWGNFAPTMFYDGQGFMVLKSTGVTSLDELRGAAVCVQQGTTTELNLQDFDTQNNMNFDIVTFPDNVTAQEAYREEQCDALTTDRSGLVSTRDGFDNSDDHVILPGTISEEPLGPVVPHGDEQWYDVVTTVMTVLIYAEAYGITSVNVPTAATGTTAVDRLFGISGSFGQEGMGLSQTVAQDVIRAVGNYGEIYDRHLTPLGLTREGSRNALWAAAPCSDCPKGGQVYAAPPR